MKRSILMMSLLFLTTFGIAHAQYKSIGPDGRVTYSDTPPPPTAKTVQVKNFDTGPSTAGLPFDVQQAVSKYPVILYTGASCAACDSGRSALKSRGVPFSERTVKSNEEIEVLKKISPDLTVPVLMVGTRKLVGYDPSAWNSALTDATYPATSKLPRDYQFPAAQSAAPKAAEKQDKQAKDDSANTITEPPPPTGNAPPGFKF